MRYHVVITEMNIEEAARPEVFRYVLEAETESDATVMARERFSEQIGRGPGAPRDHRRVAALAAHL